ncbi:6-phosphogluconolactonase [Ferriphaselus sp. R-1]|uniref:6-phosphogluconolactonase n=1 Tax=Ferriphaselus sp. R-1 TaxID=1485544 RepID=UPI00054FDAFA|nr:6-phosphogluconolactonase [Ferriphaselus sp. R-1]
MPTRQLCLWRTFATATQLEQAAVQHVLTAAEAAIHARGAFHLVLAGGTTPRRVYEALRSAHADWAHWHVWFGDERCLPPEHAERNSRMAGLAWLDHVAIPAGQVHAIPAELGPAEAAGRYAQALADVGEFDLVLLGLGEDGHTASLFPGHNWGTLPAAPDAMPVSDAPKPPPQRVSLSAQRLGRARAVTFLVTGTGKRDAVAAWRAGQAIPATSITPAQGVEIWLEQLCCAQA